MKWPNVPIGNIAKVISGYAFKSKEFKPIGDIPVIKIANIRRGYVDLSDAVFVSNDFISLDTRFQVTFGDILISLTGSHITLPNSVVGRVAKYRIQKTSLLNQRAGKFLIDTTIADKDFVYYALSMQETLERIASFAHGAANQANISPSNVESVTISLPPLPTQQRIASILSAYDDLIENNLRRIQLLEDAARCEYKMMMDESETKMKQLGLECDLIMGQSPPSSTYNKTGEGVPFHQGVTNFGTRFVKHESFCKAPTKLSCPNDILISVRAPVGRLNFTQDIICVGRGLAAIRNKSGFQQFQFQQLKDFFFFEDRIGSGAIFNATTKKELETLELPYPSNSTIEKLELSIEPIHEQIKTLTNQNIILRQARDILLPKLMSGEIEVL